MSMECTQKVPEYTDKFQPCTLMGAVQAAAGVRNAPIALHAPLGCNITATHLRNDMIPDGSYSGIVSSGLMPSDCITGGKYGLITTLRDMVGMKMVKVGKPELIWVATGCSTSIIGDDITGAAHQVEEETGIKIIALDTPGFKGSFYRGAEIVYNALLDNFVTETQGKQEGVNLVGPNLMGSKNWPYDLMEIKRLLEAADIKVNAILTHDTPMDDIRKFGEARANYLLTSEDLPDFTRRSQRLNQRVWGKDVILPLGIANTEEWYLKVAEEFGDVDKAKKQMEEDMERVKRILYNNYNASWALSFLSAKQAGVYGFAPFAAAMARYLFYDLNIRPKVIALNGESPEAIKTAEGLLEPLTEYLDFEVLENPSYQVYGKKMVEVGCDFSIGQRADKPLSEGLGIPQNALGGFYFWSQFNFVPWPYMGILGSLNLLSEMTKLMEETFYEKGVWKGRRYLNREEKARLGV